MKLIELNITKIIDICRNHKVKSLAVFGSVLTDRFNDKSDIDFLIDFENVSLDSFDYVDNFLSLLASLENLLGRTVDLVVGESMRNKYFIQNVNRTKKVIYG